MESHCRRRDLAVRSIVPGAAFQQALPEPEEAPDYEPSPRILQSFVASMLPPDTMQTILPAPAWPEEAQATGQAPAPSAMTRLHSASKRTAAATSPQGQRAL